MMKLIVDSENFSYDIYIGNGEFSNISSYLLPYNNKTLLVTDDGIPSEYINTLETLVPLTDKVYLSHGEENKNQQSVFKILDCLCNNKFRRCDRIIALGGGVVGDLAGFAASVYMRGIEFINIPSTLLSQVDSSVGGKTGFDFNGHKNLIGTFYPPSKVIIDPELCRTQNNRDLYSGMMEALKMGLCYDESLVDDIENYSGIADLEKIIVKSVSVKKSVVEKDEKDRGVRKTLNFGHTVGHAIELECDYELLHGECVAIGMLAVASEDIKKRLIDIYQKFGIPYNYSFNLKSILNNLLYDKKSDSDGIELVFLSEYQNPCTKIIPYFQLSEFLDNFNESRRLL